MYSISMSQTSFLSPETAPRVQVLAPYPLSRAYDYILPPGMTVERGDYVRIPLGRRETAGVVWDVASDASLDTAKLKTVLQKYDVPPMNAAQQKFIDWVARYTMSDTGSVLKMCLPVPEALLPPREIPAYTFPDILPKKLSDQRKKIILALQDGVPRTAADISRISGCSASVVRAMATAGQLLSVPVSAPAPCMEVDLSPTKLEFTRQQKETAAILRARVEQGGYTSILLDGVTGSGKTEVYFEAVAEALAQGRQVLILLPEISLSTQFLDRFERRFGTLPALWHSEVSIAQKRLTWRGVAEGKTRVVIGARSALFLPFRHLGLIVVDEEHDASYKQEEGVLYHARDMAIVRARLDDFPIVLVSATPSLESISNAQAGKYLYLHLQSRTLKLIHIQTGNLRLIE